MSAEFYTEIYIKGTKEECIEIMKVLCYYANDRHEQYREKRDCWYLDALLNTPEEEVNKNWEAGEMSVSLGGPYGIMNGPLGDIIDLFERIADAAPTCYFYGFIKGWDPGARQSLEAELKEGLLYLRDSYEEDGESFDDYDDEDDIEEYEEEIEEEEEEDEGDKWDKTYDPKTGSYSRLSSVSGGSVDITVTFTDKKGNKHILSLPSESIEYPINLYSYPEDFLAKPSIFGVLELLIDTIHGGGAEERIEDIKAFKEQMNSELKEDTLAKLELVKIHDHEAPFFFPWFREKLVYPEMKKLAKKVCTCAEKDRQKNIELFENYLNNLEPGFPGSNVPGWPEFCRYHIKEKGENWASFEHNPNHNCRKTMDWSCAANTAEEFARLICSKENPKEYAIERVVVDYETGTTEQTALYMPGGPQKKEGTTTA